MVAGQLPLDHGSSGRAQGPHRSMLNSTRTHVSHSLVTGRKAVLKRSSLIFVKPEEIVALEGAAAILDFVEVRRGEFAEAHLVTALHRIAKSRDGATLRTNPVLRDVIGSLHECVRHAEDDNSRAQAGQVAMPPRHLANTIWALARLSCNEGPLIKDVFAWACHMIRMRHG